MNRIIGLLLLCFLLGGVATADNARNGRGLFGDVDGYLIISNEDDQLDNDPTILKSELSLWKDFTLNSIQFQPYYYFRNDTSADGLQSVQLTENMAGIDLVIQQNEQLKVSTGIAYKYRYKASGNNDGLMITRFRLDF